MTLKQIRKYLNLHFAVFTLLAMLAVSVLGVSNAFAADDHNLPCGTETAIIKCPNVSGYENSDSDNGILALLVLALQIMTAGVGIVAVGGFIYGGVLYASAGDKSEQVKKAIEVIRNVIIGVIAYGMMYAFLNFLIPGGVFK